MKRLLLFIYPLIVTWDVTWNMPAECKNNQPPDPYTGACIQKGIFKMSHQFTERQDYEKWKTNIPKNNPIYSIGNVQVFEYDDKKTPEINK